MSRREQTTSPLCELLPWYVNGTLDEAEQKAMIAHLDHCQACREERIVLGEIQETLGREAVAVLPRAPIPDALFDDDKRQRSAGTARHAITGLALAAGIAAVAVAIVLTRGPALTGPGTLFETATAPAVGNATFDYVLHLEFHGARSAEERDATIRALNPESVAGPDSNGSYRLIVRLPAQSMDELEAFRRRVEAREPVSRAEIIAIELPIEGR